MLTRLNSPFLFRPNVRVAAWAAGRRYHWHVASIWDRCANFRIDFMDGHNAPSDHASLSPSGSVRWPMVLPSDEPCLRHRFRGRAFSCEYGGGRRCLSRDGVAGVGGRRRCFINIDGKRPARAEVPRDAWNGAGIGTAHHRELNVHSPPDRGSLAGLVEVRSFPDEVYRESPSLREYRSLERDNRTYVVEPHERTVIEEIE